MSQQTNLLQAPDPVETADIHFKICCKLKIFDSSTKYSGGYCSLIAVSQYYGLVFVGNLNGFTVIKTKSINGNTTFNEYPRRDIILNSTPTHISVDFSQKLLVVVSSSLYLYNIASFLTKDAVAMKTLSLSKNQFVVELTWQPNAENILMICMTDGLVLALNPNNIDGAVNTLPSSADAKCLCWSPKGKQIVIGCGNGTISQYKPDLKLVKTLPAPPLYNGNVTVVGILWISSFQFAVAYNDKSADVAFPVIVIVNATKNEPVTFINYDDITFSSTLFRNHQVYMIHQSAWNLTFVSSANGIEVALLYSKDGSVWQQWLLGDASRAELPLNADHQETFPLGLALDLTSEEPITWGEKTLPPMPRILLLSDEGVLCVFTVVNLIENAPQLCSPPKENVDDSLFIVPAPVNESFGKVEQVPQNVVSQPPAAVVQPSTPAAPALTHSFGSKPTFSFSSNSGLFGSQAVSFQNKLAGDAKTQLFQEAQQQQQVAVQPIVLSTQGPAQASTNSFKFLSNSPQFGGSAVTTSAPPFSFSFTNTSTNLFGAKSSPTTLPGKPSVTITPVPPLNASKGESPAPAVSGVSAGVAFSISKSPSQVDAGAGKANLFRTTTGKPVESAEKAESKPTKKTDEVPEAVAKPGDNKEKGSGEASEPAAPPELPAVDDSVYWNALQEEIEHFNSELKQLSNRMRSLDIQIGTEEDKAKQRKRLENLYEFWKDLKETTAGQSSEIHSVVTDLMESFAWLEDAKSRNLQRKNPSFVELKKSEELDPISARHMSDIAHLKYYIESQLKQLTSHLEKEWMDHQDNYRMEVKNRMAVPPLEEVYKTMHYQLKILSKQRSLVEELKEKMAAKKRKDKSQMTLVANSNQVLSNSQTGNNRISELSKLADNLLQLKIAKEDQISDANGWEAMRAQLKAIAERSKKLSTEKQAVLRDVLSERDMVKIRPVKTTFESSSFLRTAPLQKSVSKMETSKRVETAKKVQDEPKKEKQVAKPTKESPKVKETAEKEKQVEKKKEEGTKGIFVFGKPPAEKPSIQVQEKKEKCPLASLSGIVSSIGKENDIQSKPSQSITFGESPQALETSKGFPGLVSRLQQQSKKEEAPSIQTFSFSVPKPEPNFGSKTESLFGAKSSFGAASTSSGGVVLNLSSPKLEISKGTASVSVNAVATTATAAVMTNTTATTTTTSSLFGFSTATTTTSLPKVNLFSNEGQKSESAGSGNLFFGAGKSGQSTVAPIFGSVAPAFKTTGNKTGFETQTTSLFGVPKNTEAVSQASSFSFAAQKVENKTPATPEVSVVTSSKDENEEVDVVTVEVSIKKPEEGKSSPKAMPTSTIVFGGATPVPKSVAEVSTTTVTVTTAATQSVDSTSSVQVSTTAQSSPDSTTTTTTTTSIFTKPVVPASVEMTKTSTAPAVISQAATTTPATTSSVFSFATSSTPLVFGQAAATPVAATTATTTPTTTASIFGQSPSTTSSIFGQVSSSTPTTNIFGGGTTPTTSTSIFGGSPLVKPIFGQASATPSTPTSGSIFGGSATTTPTTNTFGQVSTPPVSSPSVFGQKPDAVAQTANSFEQLLSDSTRAASVFSLGTTTATPTTNIFSTPKNIFGGGGSGSAGTTTSNLFGKTSSSSSSIFPQTTSVFGQPTTSGSIFGQTGQTSTSSSFFGQNICSPFGGTGGTGTSVESSGGFGSKPNFGQSLFGQTTSNQSFFGGSSNTTSLFGSSSSSNVFQTPTTSTFGSTSPGPFSSGQGSVAVAGFRPAGTFQRPATGGFGSPPVFGGSPTLAPAFGAPPTFSGSSFGSPPTFGSRPLLDSSQSGTFGQSQGHSTTFENLASQNTVGFGNLAQQSQSQGFGAFGGAPAFENKPAFGGNSFSSWRSS